MKLKLELRAGTKDILIAHEVIEKDCYRLKSWRLTEPKVIVDVGCQVGCFSALACSLFPDCRVLSFEMLKENFLMAQDNLKVFKNNECINVAVGGKNPIVGSFYNHNNTGGHKVVFEGADSYIGEKRIDCGYQLSNGDIKMVNFQQIFENYNLEEIDFLKLDCEGSEHEILLHLFETGLINKVKNIALEMHGRDQQECFYILSELKKIYKSVDITGPQGNLVFCQDLFSERKPINFYNLTWENSRSTLPRSDYACFVSSREGFPVNKIRGKEYLQKYNFLGKELTVTPEIIYRKIPEFEKFKDKKILVIGAGPTTNWYDWNPNEYDYIFSCNHFFLNEKIKKIKVDLAIVNNEVDLKGEEFLNYIQDNDTILAFDDYDADINHVIELKKTVKNKIFQCVMRHQPKTGVAPKLVVLATLLGAKQVDYVGIDGPPKGTNSHDWTKEGSMEDDSHSFQKNKTWNVPYPRELFLRQYECFKVYLEQEIGIGVTYNNLGAGHEQNILSKI